MHNGSTRRRGKKRPRTDIRRMTDEKKKNLHIQQAQGASIMINTKRVILRHIIVNMLEVKNKNNES